jgi:GGDEF domain-containing protein
MLTTLHSCVLLVIGSILVVMALFLRGQRLVIADLEERLEGLTEQVGFDDLTGVYRRTAGERRARLSLRTMPCIVGFIDVRDFGMVNKTMGWAEGDRQLVELTRSLAMYNTKEDTDKLIIALEEVINIFKK